VEVLESTNLRSEEPLLLQCGNLHALGAGHGPIPAKTRQGQRSLKTRLTGAVFFYIPIQAERMNYLPYSQYIQEWVRRLVTFNISFTDLSVYSTSLVTVTLFFMPYSIFPLYFYIFFSFSIFCTR
jgi:hypothetical protein